MAILKVGAISLPAPTVLEVTIQDLDSETGTGRNQSGELFRDRVAVKRTIRCEWGILTKSQISDILTAISPIFFSLTYPDPESGAFKTITAYVGNRTMPIAIFNGSDWIYRGMSADFIEM